MRGEEGGVMNDDESCDLCVFCLPGRRVFPTIFENNGALCEG